MIEVIDSHRVIDTLGEGSFAVSYKIINDSEQLSVLKLMRSDISANSTLRFQNEVWALQTLNHSSIPKFHSSGTFEGRPYIVMSLAPGKSLRKYIEQPVAETGSFGERWVTKILLKLFEAVIHLNDNDIQHRDIKDANVIVNEDASSVVLIDYGFCKGDRQPAEADSFLQVGAPRYSSPNKLRYPSRDNKSHDVFAIGVLGYLLLTRRYPWSVPPDQDHGLLAQTMEQQAPIPITELNSLVSYEMNSFILSILNCDDRYRPSAETALHSLKKISETDYQDLSFISQYSSTLPKVTRDPIHGDIRLNKFETDLIDTTEFQNLRHLKQLGFANFAFIGAEHTRLAHSIGTMHVASQIIDSISNANGKIDTEQRLLIRAYALVHDLTHIPFGHTLEDELGIFTRHDRNSSRIKRVFDSRNSNVARLLKTTSYGRSILECVLNEEYRNKLILAKDIVDGHSGADVIDYVDRDSFHCGVDHKVDSAIFRHFRVDDLRSSDEVGGSHMFSQLFGSKGVRLDAEFAVESLLLQRFALYMKIYGHSAKLSAGAMLGKAISYIVKREGADQIERKIEKFGDTELISWIRSSSYAKAKRFGDMLRVRNIYKPVFIASALEESYREMDAYNIKKEEMQSIGLNSYLGRGEFEGKIATKCGLNEEDIILYWPNEAPGLQKVRYYVQQSAAEEPQATTPERHRRMIERHLGLWKVYVFAKPSLNLDQRIKVADAVGSALGMKNSVRFG